MRRRDAEDVVLLTGTAAVLWQLLETPQSMPELCQQLARMYGVDDADLQDDVRRALDTAVLAGIVTGPS